MHAAYAPSTTIHVCTGTARGALCTKPFIGEAVVRRPRSTRSSQFYQSTTNARVTFATYGHHIEQVSPIELLEESSNDDRRCVPAGRCESEQQSADIDATEVPYGGSDGNGPGRQYPNGPGGGEGDADDTDLPDDLTEALALNIVGREAVTRYSNFIQIPILGALMSVTPFRTRMLADSSFFFKLLIQELVGNGTALASEIAVRGKDIVDELEYVASDLIVGTVVEAAFVWLLAPTLSLPSKAAISPLGKFLRSLPANAFEASTPLRVYSFPMRFASFVYAGGQYAAIGFVAGVVGTAITYGLIEARKAVDKTYSPLRPLPAVLPNSVAWGAFMALSSNTRFQAVEGLERAIAKLFNGTSSAVVNSAIVALRFANNYWGGVQFVQFFRYLGLHATGDGGGH